MPPLALASAPRLGQESSQVSVRVSGQARTSG
jgi:hypothetical protein